MSGGTAEHSAVTLNLLAELRSALAGRGCRAFESNMRVHVPATGRYVYPDGRVGAASGESSLRVHVPERTGLPPDRSSAANARIPHAGGFDAADIVLGSGPRDSRLLDPTEMPP